MTVRSRSGSAFESLASYCRAVRIGDTIAVSGTASLDEDGQASPIGDVGAQVRRALDSALAAAAELGAAREDVVRTRVYLAPGSDWRAAAEVHGDIFRGVDPANTTLFVAGFIPPHCLTEVELDAVVMSDTNNIEDPAGRGR